MDNEKLFTPFKLKDFTLKNRIGVAPMTRLSSAAESIPRQDVFDFLVRRAENGVAVVYTGVRLDNLILSFQGTCMARKPRIHYPGAFYHVMLRGNGGQDIFFSNNDRCRFTLLLQEGIERYKHHIHAFCHMTKHVHLVIQVGEPPLSRVMQNLSFRYTCYINSRSNQALKQGATAAYCYVACPLSQITGSGCMFRA